MCNIWKIPDLEFLDNYICSISDLIHTSVCVYITTSMAQVYTSGYTQLEEKHLATLICCVICGLVPAVVSSLFHSQSK